MPWQHWVIAAASFVGALGVLYAAVRQLLQRAMRALHNALAVWRLPECVESLTQAVETLTEELTQLRGNVQHAEHRSMYRREW